MTKENILKHVEELGKKSAAMSKTNYWSLEDHSRAKTYLAETNILRAGYAMIKNDEILKGLNFLRKSVNGITGGNKIGLLIMGFKDEFNETHSWEVVDGDLKFKS